MINEVMGQVISKVAKSFDHMYDNHKQKGYKDTFYDMKCTSCTHEGKLLDIATLESEFKNPRFH